MATPTIVTTGGVATGGDQTMTIASGAGVQTGDMIVIAHCNDFYQLNTLETPTCATTGTFTGYGDISSNPGNNNAMLGKWWAATVVTGGQQDITIGTVPNDGSYAAYAVIRGTSLALDPASPPTGQANNTASIVHTCPSTSPVTADALLLCAVVAGNNGVVTFTPASGMTQQTIVNGPPFSSLALFSEALSASGATGTRTHTPSASRRYAGLTISFSAGGGRSASVGQATESGAALPVAAAKVSAAGVAAETGTALPVAATKALAVGLAAATGSALPITATKILTVGLATDTGLALPITAPGTTTVPVGVATGTDLALPITALKLLTVGQAAEAGTGFGVTALKTRPVGQATEISTALPVTSSGPVVRNLRITTGPPETGWRSATAETPGTAGPPLAVWHTRSPEAT